MTTLLFYVNKPSLFQNDIVDCKAKVAWEKLSIHILCSFTLRFSKNYHHHIDGVKRCYNYITYVNLHEVFGVGWLGPLCKSKAHLIVFFRAVSLILFFWLSLSSCSPPSSSSSPRGSEALSRPTTCHRCAPPPPLRFFVGTLWFARFSWLFNHTSFRWFSAVSHFFLHTNFQKIQQLT